MRPAVGQFCAAVIGRWSRSEGPKKGPTKKRMVRSAPRFGVPYSKGVLLASGLLGLPRSPQLPVGLGALSPAGRLWAPELLRLPASARSPSGLTQIRVWALGFRDEGPCRGGV